MNANLNEPQLPWEPPPTAQPPSDGSDFVVSLAGALHRQGMACHHLESLVLLVPGSLGLRSLFALSQENVLSGVEAAYQMVIVAVAIVTGLLLGNLILPSRRPSG